MSHAFGRQWTRLPDQVWSGERMLEVNARWPHSICPKGGTSGGCGSAALDPYVVQVGRDAMQIVQGLKSMGEYIREC